MSESGPKRKATYQDVLDAPEHMIAEIIGGELRLSPRPANPATFVASILQVQIGGPFGPGGGHGGWVILFEPELHLGDNIVVPDLAGWRIERMPVIPDEAFFTLPPDWVCEVLSKSTERTDRAEKMPLYARFGIGHAWLVHPRRRTLEVFRLQDGKWVAIDVFKDDDRANIEPFEAIELEVGALWSRLPLLPTHVSEGAAEYEL